MESMIYKDKPQVNTGYYDLVNAIILRTVQDCFLKNLALGNTHGRKKVKSEAESFVFSEQFKFMCECVNKNWNDIQRFVLKGGKINE